MKVLRAQGLAVLAFTALLAGDSFAGEYQLAAADAPLAQSEPAAGASEPSVARGNGALSASKASTTQPSELTEVQSIYLERCGGCHGIQGHSAPREVPSLRGQVGFFLCLPESRAYLVRLPSVASSQLSDELLAELMNFVVFDLGSRPADRAAYPPYTAAEVSELRKQPLNNISLVQYRGTLVAKLIDQCGAPQGLREYAGRSNVRTQ